MLDITGPTAFFLLAPIFASNLLFLIVGIAGIAGAFFAATTREDAYSAAGRQNKWVWVAIVAIASFVCLWRVPFVSWFGAVAIGIYFLDVRPQLNNIIRGNSGW